MQNNVKILIGSHGSGKSNWIYNYFFSNATKDGNKKIIDLNKKFYLVVPEQDTNDKQRTLMKESEKRGYGAGIINMDVVSFDRIAHNIFDILGIEPEKENVIEDDAKTMMLSLTLSRLYKEGKIKYYSRMIDKIGFAKKLTQVVSEFYAYNVKSDDIEKVINNGSKSNFRDKLGDLKLIYEEFRKDLKEKNFSIKEDKYYLLSENIDKVDIFDDAIVAFDGFTGFTPIQMDIFKKICSVAKEVYVSIDIRDTESLYKDKKIEMVDVFYLSKKYINDIAKALATIGKELPYTNYIDMNNGEVIKFSSKKDLAFLEKHVYDYSDNVEKIKSQNIELHVAKNIKDEVKNACDIINELIRKNGYKYNDIRIIVPIISDYADIMQKASNKYGIPIFIDDTTGIFNSPYIETIRAALDIVNYDFKYDSVMRYISAGTVDKDKKLNLLDNYIREFGLRGHKAYEGNLEEYRYIFDPLIKLYYNLHKNNEGLNTIKEYLDSLNEFIAEIELKTSFDKFVSSIDINSYNYEKQKKMLDVSLDAIDATFKNLEIINSGNNEKYDIEDFRKVLDVGLSEASVKSIPYMLDQVIVGDFMRSRFDNPKVCIILGLNQSKIPGQTLDLSIIDDKMREKFEEINVTLSQTTIETALNQRFYIYLALTNPTDKLILSYTRTNSDDNVDEKSSVIYEVQRLIELNEKKDDIGDIRFFNKNEMIDFIAENIDLAKKYYQGVVKYDAISEKKAIIVKNLIDYLKDDKDFIAYYDKIINQNIYEKNEIIPKELIDTIHNSIYKDGFVASATAIETFNKCPYNYYLNNTIRLKERKYYEVNSIDLGRFYHAALNIIFRNNYDIRKDNDIKNTVDSAINKIEVNNYKFTLKTNKVEYIKDRAKAVLITSLKVLKTIAINSKLDIYLTEKEFKYTDSEASLTGRIDVIDKYSNEDKTFINIIDYKSGKKAIKVNDIIDGIDIQLMLYLDYCLTEKIEKGDKKVIPCGSFYFTLEDPIIKIYDYNDVSSLDKKINEEMSFNGIASADIENVKIINSDLDVPNSKKDGIYASKDNGFNIKGISVNETELDDLRKKVKDKISESVAAIKNGIIDKKPHDGVSDCKYCQYKNICRKEFVYEDE